MGNDEPELEEIRKGLEAVTMGVNKLRSAAGLAEEGAKPLRKGLTPGPTFTRDELLSIHIEARRMHVGGVMQPVYKIADALKEELGTSMMKADKRSFSAKLVLAAGWVRGAMQKGRR